MTKFYDDMKGFYLITDNNLSKNGLIEDIKSALKANVCLLQYRNKDDCTKILIEQAIQIKKIIKSQKNKKTRLIINDRIDIALSIDADGVHLGQDDMSYETARKLLGKDKIIGITVHNKEEAIKAQHLGADYLGVSPMFDTTTKSDAGKPAGIKLIEEIKKEVNIPLFAIGGITLDNTPDVIKAGADGVCAISAVITKHDVTKEIRRFQQLFDMK